MKKYLALALALCATPLAAMTGKVDQVSVHMGEMSVTMGPGDGTEVKDSIRFEPFQMLDDLFERDDYVFLMRHGPTNWSKLDVYDVAPTDCENQRVMTEEGKLNMEELGVLLAVNGLLPGQIVVSEWCRNQQTLEAILKGFDRVDPEIRNQIPIETDSELNLLLSLQGAENVVSLRDRITNWEGNGKGPLLLITHFTNIEELTTFTVFEGEMLMVDPKRENRVLGYLRLRSSRPDVGHFDPR